MASYLSGLIHSGRSSLPLSHGHFSSGDSRIIPSLCYFQASMVLLQVNMPRISLAPFERDAPGTIDVNGVALRLAAERMEVEAGNVEIARRRSPFQRIQSPKRPVLEVCRHSSASTFAKQLVKPFVTEAPYHRDKRNTPDYMCKSTRYSACVRRNFGRSTGSRQRDRSGTQVMRHDIARNPHHRPPSGRPPLP